MSMEFLQDNINRGVKLLELFSTEPSLTFGGMSNLNCSLFCITYV